MKPISRISLVLITLVILLAAFPGAAYAQTTGGDEGKFVFGGSYSLDSGDTLYGGLVVVGGSAELEEGSLVVGDVVVVGGQVEIYGEVDGNVIVVGGQAYLGEESIVNDDLVTIGGAVQREEGALVRGAITAEMPEGFNLNGFSPETLQVNRSWRSYIWEGFRPLGDMIMNVMQALAMAALAAVLALFLLKPMERVSQAVVIQPLPAGGLGILTMIVLPALLVVLAITIILIPLSLIGFLVLGAGFVFGWIALGLEVGKRMEKMFKVEESWAPAVRAGVGTLTLSLLSFAVGLVPCVGWILPFLVSMLSLGGVVLTLFGTRDYPPVEVAKTAAHAPKPEVVVGTSSERAAPGLDALLADAAEDAESVNDVDDIPGVDGEVTE
ncbi:MAG: hypothetical protein RBT34_06950 [Anaerolineaceae bacterium]|jgi:hypothetical protein|nr:hypothetical protein [Anaerolineaceae bacterium]